MSCARPRDGRRRPPRAARRARTSSLSPTEYNLLRYLLVNQGRVLSKAQILDHVWQYDFGGDGGVVETYIGYLRRKVDNVDPRCSTPSAASATRCANLRPDMSLRARLIVAMAVVGVVLVLAAVAITRTTESYLVARSTTSWRRRPAPANGSADRGPGPPSSSARRRRTASSSTPDRSARSSSRTTTTTACPSSTACRTPPVSRRRLPDIPIARVVALEPGERESSPSAATSGPRYRVLAQRPGNGDAALVVAHATRGRRRRDLPPRPRRARRDAARSSRSSRSSRAGSCASACGRSSG